MKCISSRILPSLLLILSSCSISLPLGPTRAGSLIDQYLADSSGTKDTSSPEDAKAKLVELGEDATPYVLERLDEADPVSKRKLLILLSAIGKPEDEVNQNLIKATKEQDNQIREIACLALGKSKFNSIEGTQRLTELLGDPEPRVRAAAATSFGTHPQLSSEVIKELQKLVLDRDPYVSNSALNSLLRRDTSLGIASAKKIGGKVIQRITSEQPYIRLSAAFIVSQVPGLYRAAESVLIDQLNREQVVLIKAQLASTLVRVNSKTALRAAHPALIQITQTNDNTTEAGRLAEQALILLKEQRPEAKLQQ